MSGKPVVSRGMRAFPLWAVWEYLRQVPEGLVADLRQAYVDLLRERIRFEIRLLQDSLARLGLPKL